MTYLYRSGRAIVSFLLRQFFHRITVRGAALVTDRPLLIVANHPNAALDPALMIMVANRSLWFIAKSSFFNPTWVGTVLRWCRLIPVYRREDTPTEMSKNVAALAGAAAVLKRGEALLVFPEGASMGERKLFDFKTGAARIALAAEAESDWKLGSVVQAVGTTYSNYFRFRSTVTVVVGEPVAIESFRARYQTDPAQAVRDLTDLFEEQIRAITVSLGDPVQAELVELIGRLYSDHGYGADDFERLKTIAHNVIEFAPKYPERAAIIRNRLKKYDQLADTLLPVAGVASESISSRVLLAFVTPFAVLGLLIFWLPYRITGPLAVRLASHPVYTATNKLGVGVIVFSLWILFLLFLVLAFGGTGKTILVTLVLLIVSGHCINNYRHRVWLLLFGRAKPLQTLRSLREELVQELNQLRVV